MNCSLSHLRRSNGGTHCFDQVYGDHHHLIAILCMDLGHACSHRYLKQSFGKPFAGPTSDFPGPCASHRAIRLLPPNERFWNVSDLEFSIFYLNARGHTGHPYLSLLFSLTRNGSNAPRKRRGIMRCFRNGSVDHVPQR